MADSLADRDNRLTNSARSRRQVYLLRQKCSRYRLVANIW